MDIARDAMRMVKEGKSMPEVQAYINDYYSQFGTPNTGGPSGS